MKSQKRTVELYMDAFYGCPCELFVGLACLKHGVRFDLGVCDQLRGVTLTTQRKSIISSLHFDQDIVYIIILILSTLPFQARYYIIMKACEINKKKLLFE